MAASTMLQTHVVSGHESFPLRFTWLTKAVRACERPEERDSFSRPDAVVALGVGKNMVRSIRSWALATGMLESDGPSAGNRATRLRPTTLGSLLFAADGLDPFMEDPATTWLIHWSLASTPRMVTWYLAFNELRDAEFERSRLVREVLRASEVAGRAVAEETVERDVDCFLRSYAPAEPDRRASREELLDCPLTELGLIRRAGPAGVYALHRGLQDSLPDAVFARAMHEFWSRKGSTARTMRFDEVAYEAGGPGQVFRLSENALVDRMYGLAASTGGAIRYDDTANVRQLLRGDEELDTVALLRAHYESYGGLGPRPRSYLPPLPKTLERKVPRARRH